MFDITNELTDDFEIYAGTLVMFIDSIFILCFVVLGVAEHLSTRRTPSWAPKK